MPGTPAESAKKPAASPPSGVTIRTEAVVTLSTRLRSSSGTVSYITVAIMGLRTPKARPSIAIVTASGATVPVRAATRKRGMPPTRKATVNTGHRLKRPATAP